jgi:phosphate transport system permease protein
MADVVTNEARADAPPNRSAGIERKRIDRRMLVDRLARRVVTLGGLTIIASILAIFFVIAGEAYPLFRKPTATHTSSVHIPLDSSALAIGVDEYREVIYVITESGIYFRSASDGSVIESAGALKLDGAKVTAVSAGNGAPIGLGLSDGRVLTAQLRFSSTFASDGKRTIVPELVAADPVVVDSKGRRIQAVAHVEAPGGTTTVAAIEPNEIVIVTVHERKALIGKGSREVAQFPVTLPIDGRVTSILMDSRGEDLFAGTSQGQVLRVDIRDPAKPHFDRPVTATSAALSAVTALRFLIGDRTIVVGDSNGGISTWQILLDGDGDRALTRTVDFGRRESSVRSVAASARDKGFLVLDEAGLMRLCYATTGTDLLEIPTSADVQSAILAPKANAIFTIDSKGAIDQWELHNPHPEVSARSLFGKVWYEGYNQPQYVWQSTGGTDDFEAKLSLVPLIYGTFKGTFYALAFAVPIALLAALYASQFMHPDIKRYVKPTVEIMAALPSVVLGFIAGLWLAPIVERIGPGIFLFPFVTAALVLIAVVSWQYVPAGLRRRMRTGSEVFLLVPVVVVAAIVSFYGGGLLERSLLGGDYRTWLLSALGLTFDQRNSLVVAFAMGFAVIPIIFTIAEDSLSNVPRHLTAGSLALGATRWQTAIRVVLPTASPGIFSAVMIGFGRAVGETMIVLMATGNTPVMDWSMFNGFRALSANIAVELPEAPMSGTLYRVLFLAALLLFLMTFLVNTLAELVRLRLRKKYRYL